MIIDDYQRLIDKFDLYPDAIDKLLEFSHPSHAKKTLVSLIHYVGLAGEVGELGEKIKKMIRDGDIDLEAIAKELGDIEWYLTRIETDFGFTKSKILELNITKLTKRLEQDKLHGKGDDREDETN